MADAPNLPTQNWVLLRGLVREHRHWGDFATRLAQRFNAQTFCPELAGNGWRYREPSPLHLGSAVDDLKRQVVADGPIHLLGLSMGGMLAWEWARRYPEQVQGLVLVNSSFGNLSPPWQRMRPSALAALLSALPRAPAARESTIYQLTCARQDDRQSTLPAWQRWAEEHPVSRANFLRQIFAAARYRSAVLTIPPLVLNSQGDRLVSPACSEAIARRYDGRLITHPWGGHDLPHDDPDWVLTEIARWQSARTQA